MQEGGDAPPVDLGRSQFVSRRIHAMPLGADTEEATPVAKRHGTMRRPEQVEPYDRHQLRLYGLRSPT